MYEKGEYLVMGVKCRMMDPHLARVKKVKSEKPALSRVEGLASAYGGAILLMLCFTEQLAAKGSANVQAECVMGNGLWVRLIDPINQSTGLPIDQRRASLVLRGLPRFTGC